MYDSKEIYHQSEAGEGRGIADPEVMSYLESMKLKAEKMLDELKEQLSEIETNVLFAPESELVGMSKKDCIRHRIVMEKIIYGLCLGVEDVVSYYSHRYPTLQMDIFEEKRKNEGVSWLVQRPNLILLKTPYLRKMTSAKMASSLPFDALVKEIYTIDPNRFPRGPVDLYVLSVYPPETPDNRVIDPDNINVKAFGDSISHVLDLNDNGVNQSLIIYAMKTADLELGSYMVYTPEKEVKMSKRDLVETIKTAQKPTSAEGFPESL